MHTVLNSDELLQQIIISLPSAGRQRASAACITAWQQDTAVLSAVRKSRCIEPAEITGTDSNPEDKKNEALNEDRPAFDQMMSGPPPAFMPHYWLPP